MIYTHYQGHLNAVLVHECQDQVAELTLPDSRQVWSYKDKFRHCSTEAKQEVQNDAKKLHIQRHVRRGINI